jgi:hypothetical protein
MLASALVLLLVTAPQVELVYRFEKDATYLDESKAVTQFRLFSGTKIVKYHIEVERVLERTILELDDRGQPVRERVVVKKFLKRTVAAPDADPGETPTASQGKTFVWKKGRRGWALWGEKGDVGAQHEALVEVLSNWRSSRLPGRPVAPGDTWEIAAAEILRSAGQRVQGSVEGSGTFRLESVDDGLARVSFRFESKQEVDGRAVEGKNEGTWLFDLAAGVDRSLAMKGTVLIDGGKGGDGSIEMTRTVTVGREPTSPGG